MNRKQRRRAESRRRTRSERAGQTPSAQRPTAKTAAAGGAAKGALPTVEAIEKAAGLQQSGRLDEAEAIYERILAQDPEQAQALHFSALIALQKGLNEKARALIERALSRAPTQRGMHHNHAMILQALGDLEGADAAYRRALAIDPEAVQSLSNLGALLIRRGGGEEARVLLRRAVTLAPGNAAAHANLGNAELVLGRKDEAEAQYRKALVLSPGHQEARLNLARLLIDSAREREALLLLDQVVQGRPRDATAHHLRALALRRFGDLEGALKAAEAASELAPSALHLETRGNLLAAQFRYSEALECFTRAIAQPDAGASCHANLGKLMTELGRAKTALRSFKTARGLAPEDRRVAWNHAIAQLAAGGLAAGWEDYEARLDPRLCQFLPERLPRWEGERLEAGSLLVSNEQGLGDQLLFATCLPDVLARQEKVALHCDPRLEGLFKRSYPGLETLPFALGDTAFAATPDVARQIPIGSLPRLFRRSLDAFPAEAPRLKPEPALLARWRLRLQSLGPGRKIGVAWRSGKERKHPLYYPSLADLAPALRESGATLICLQYDQPEAELAQAERELGLKLHRFADLDLKDDLEGQAALCRALDLVVAPGNATAVLAASVGQRVLLVARTRSWDLLGEERYPWFPRVTPILGNIDGGWSSVAQRLAVALSQPERAIPA